MCYSGFCDFITPTYHWDSMKLREVVGDADIEVILGVPISCSGVADSWCWHYSKNGIYSVKSGYKQAMK